MNLLPKTYYSIEVAAFTVRGDGIRSPTIIEQTPGQGNMLGWWFLIVVKPSVHFQQFNRLQV